MHPAAYEYVRQQVEGRWFEAVVEVGGRDINGGIRHLIACRSYVSVDLQLGPGVDVVADCRRWQPPAPVDLVVCCEVLEHAPDPHGVVQACLRYLKPGGRLVLTCAGPGRPPHSTHDGGEIRPGEHYRNIAGAELRDWLVDHLADGEVSSNPVACDTYAAGTKR